MNVNALRLTQKWWAIVPPLLLCFTAALGQENSAIRALRATERPSSKIGLPNGERIPEFRALDQDRVARDFESIRGPHGAVLYFYRSADWCIYCQAQLVETEASRKALLKNGFGLAGVSFDSPDVLKKFADAKSIHYPLLSDPDSRIIRDFQVLDDKVLPGTPGYGVPYHGYYVIDEKGRVVAKLFEPETTLAHSAGLVVSKLFGSPENTHEKTMKLNQMTLTYYASANSVSPGDDIDLVIEVALNDHIHVYAPPAGSNTPLDWKIDAPSGVKAHPVTFPPAQTLRPAGPTGDTAAVYTGNFRLSRRVTVAPEGVAALDAQGNVVLKGTFSFQACNDQTQDCYVPTTVPLDWKLAPAPSNSAASHIQPE